MKTTIIAIALLAIACAAPASAQSYQRQCGYVGKSYICHSKLDTPRAEVLTSCYANSRGSGCQSETFRKVPPPPPYSISNRYVAPKAVAGR